MRPRRGARGAVNPADLMQAIRKIVEQSGVSLSPEVLRSLDALEQEAIERGGPPDPIRLREALAEALAEGLPDLRAQQRAAVEQLEAGEAGGEEAREELVDNEVMVQSLLHPDVARRNLDRLLSAHARGDGAEVDRVLKELGDGPRMDTARLEREARDDISALMSGFRLKPLSEG